jgi:hypothetical protein
MSKKIGGVFALAGLCALSMFLVNCGSSSSRPTGLLYVLTQGTNGIGNNVSSFAIDLGSGGLSLVNSNASTCSTLSSNPPKSCGLPLDILLDTTGGAAFVLNQGVPCQHVSSTCELDSSNNPTVSIPPTIYPYTVNSDGSFSSPGTPIPLSHPTSSTDTQDDADLALAMVRDAAGKFLFVLNQGSTPAPGQGATPPPGNCQLDPLPQGNFDACPSISVFSITAGSNTLTFVGGSPLNAGNPLRLSKIPTSLSAITFTPPGGGAAEEFLFVTGIQDLTTQHNDNTLSVYRVSSSGVLTETLNSPYATSTDPISVLAVNTNSATSGGGGVFVYVGSQPTASGALSIFQMCTVVDNAKCTQADVTNALLVPVGTPAPATGQNPVAMAVDPTNAFLYVVCYGQSAVYGYHIENSTGVLTALSPANQQTGAQPVALALHPSVNNSGQFLYTSNSGSTNISGFTLSTTSGSMSSPITVVSPSTPSGMAAR